MNGTDRRSSHLFAVLGASVLWGTTGTVAHFAPEGSSALLIGLSTFGFGGLLLFARAPRGIVALIRRPGRNARWLLFGMVGVILYPTAYYVSMSLVGVAIGNVLALGSGPLFAAMLEWVISRKRLSLRWAIATAAAIAGIALLATSHGGDGGGAPVLGIVLGLVAGFGYAAYSVAGALMIEDGVPSEVSMGAMFLAGSAVMVPWFFIAGPGPLASWPGVAILAYLAVVPMAIAYLAFGYGLRGLSASTATTLALFEPIVATVLAVAIVGERLTPVAWAGVALVAVGIVVTAVPARRRMLMAEPTR